METCDVRGVVEERVGLICCRRRCEGDGELLGRHLGGSALEERN